MFGFTWGMGILFLLITTLMRYLLLRGEPHVKSFGRVFSLSPQVVGAEAALLIFQLIAASWIILGVLFDKVLLVPPGLLQDFLPIFVFFGPVYLFAWRLAPRIRRRPENP